MMTLREAIDTIEQWDIKYGHWQNPVFRDVEALRLVIKAAKQTADDTVEIVTLQTVAPADNFLV